jgi:hypothetical protein
LLALGSEVRVVREPKVQCGGMDSAIALSKSSRRPRLRGIREFQLYAYVLEDHPVATNIADVLLTSLRRTLVMQYRATTHL